MISKNKNLFLKIYIPFVIIISIALIILQILGSKNRIGYLTDFNLEIERSLPLNEIGVYTKIIISNNMPLILYKITNISDNFTIDGELYEESIKNYLLTNENITNYAHHFRIRYYDKIFRNNDIYGVYPDLSNLPDYMKNAEMEENGSPYGNFISDKKEINEDKIDNINYTLRIKPKIPILLYFILVLILIIYFYNDIHKFTINTNIYRKYDNFFTEKRFIILIICIGVILFIFQFWLCFPGYFTHDDVLNGYMYDAVFERYSNWHPVIISVFLNYMYKIFGYHTFYLFLINLLCWYSGLMLIIISLYVKLKNKSVILLYFISFTSNIFFINIIQVKDVVSSSMLWLSYSIIFFILMRPIKIGLIKKVLISLSILFIIVAMLWRHNFIVTVYPIFIFFTSNILKQNYSKTYFIKFISIMLTFAIILVSIVKIFPHIFVDDFTVYKNVTKHIYFLQIAGCLVPSNDDSIIPNNWYNEGKSFEDVINTYKKYPLFGDKYIALFNYNNISDIEKIWIKSIIRHPINYIKHTLNYTIHIWTSSDFVKPNVYVIQYKAIPYDNWEKEFNNLFDSKGITFTKTQEHIYKFIYDTSVNINTLIFVILAILLFFISGILYIKLKNQLLLFSFSTSFSAFATAVIVALFSPGASESRYMYPIIPISILSLISFITFIYDRGGFKKFFKELKGGENK